MPKHNLVLNVYPGGKPTKAKPNNYQAAIAAARRLGYHVGDEEATVPTGWHGQDDKADAPR